jgi:hypothetical protein
MSGCSIDEAFPDTAFSSGYVARKEERRKAKSCKGPALAFLKAGGEGNIINNMPNGSHYVGNQGNSAEIPDPDRHGYKVKAIPESLQKGQESFSNYSDESPSNKKWIPKQTSAKEEKEDEDIQNLIGQRVNDVIGQKSRKTLPKAIEGSGELPDPKKDMFGNKTPSYFGKSLDDSFADFSSSLQDNPGYILTAGAGAGSQGADFLGSFGSVAGLNAASGKAALATPSVNDAWKPLTPSGARTSFFELLPPPGGEMPSSGGLFSREDRESFLRKLDTLFARLEALESRKNENGQMEVSMFILSGLFLIYGLDVIRRIA